MSSFRKLLLAASAVALTMSASVSHAQIKFRTDGGFRAETEDGQFAFRVAGRIMFDYDSFDGAFNNNADGATGSDLYFRRESCRLLGRLLPFAVLVFDRRAAVVYNNFYLLDLVFAAAAVSGLLDDGIPVDAVSCNPAAHGSVCAKRSPFALGPENGLELPR